jgi:hypothetical protein
MSTVSNVKATRAESEKRSDQGSVQEIGERQSAHATLVAKLGCSLNPNKGRACAFARSISTMTALIFLALLAVANATPLSTNYLNNVQRPRFAQAPILDALHPYGTINNSYIVKFKDDVTPSLMRNHFNFLQTAHEADPIVSDDGLVSGIRHVYTHIGGYAGVFSENVLNEIRSMPEVEYVERDQIVTILETQKFAPWVSFGLFFSCSVTDILPFRVLPVSVIVPSSPSPPSPSTNTMTKVGRASTSTLLTPASTSITSSLRVVLPGA